MHSADASDEDSVSAAFQALNERIGADGLNLLINNAGINQPGMPGSLSATGKKDMMQVYETNVVGPFLIAKVGSVSLCAFSVDVSQLEMIDRRTPTQDHMPVELQEGTGQLAS